MFAIEIGWVDKANRVSIIEPVGTRMASRQQGLARALNLAALRRVRRLGVEVAQVGTANFNDSAITTYRSSRYEIVDDEYRYEKRLH